MATDRSADETATLTKEVCVNSLAVVTSKAAKDASPYSEISDTADGFPSAQGALLASVACT